MSVSFDRAAEYYDRTRDFPDEVMARLVPMLVSQLPRDELCLEIGIGTGRIALPLMAAKIRMVGVDISPDMLRKLVDKAGATPPVAIADATCLPFSAGTFGSAVAAHVLHLIPGWRSAVDELVRVVRPGGVLLASRGAASRAEWQHALRRFFFEQAGDPPWPPGVDTIDQLDDEMTSRGAAVRELEELRRDGQTTVNEQLAELEAGHWSACWSMDDATRHRAAAATRDWARRELGDLEARRPASYASVWRAYVLP